MCENHENCAMCTDTICIGYKLAIKSRPMTRDDLIDIGVHAKDDLDDMVPEDA